MNDAWFGALERSLEGRIVRSGDPEMVLSHKQHAARLPFVEPDLLIRCRSAADVAACVAVLGRAKVPFALRSGGHCFADRSNDAAVIVDCAEMTDATIDGEAATFAAGVTAGQAVALLTGHDRAIPTGGCIGVAVSGLVIAGGFGYSGRRLGFVSDRVRSLDVVLADGRALRIDAETEPDLFWACRGGGGVGLAAITGVTIATAPAVPGTAVYGEWPIERAPELMARWLRWAPDAHAAIDIELSLWATDLVDEPCTVRLHGGVAGAAATMAEIAAALGPFADDLVTTAMSPAMFAEHLVGRLDHRGETAWQPSFPFRDVGYQATRSQYLFDRPDAATLTALAERFVAERCDGQAREVEFIPWRGAYAQPPAPACIAHRDAIALVRHTALAGSRSTGDQRRGAATWVDLSHAVLVAAGAAGAYAGYAERDAAWPKAAYGSNYARLAAIKQSYDPGDCFRSMAGRL